MGWVGSDGLLTTAAGSPGGICSRCAGGGAFLGAPLCVG